MTEVTQQADSGETPNRPVNLHDIDALQGIVVRDGVSLRPIRVSDSDRILEVLKADPTIKEKVTVASRINSEADVEREVDAMNADPELIRYAITNDQDEFIGLVSFWLDPGFFGQEPLPNTYGFGYFIDPAERGKGLVTGSVKSLMKVATENIPGIEGFTAFCVDANKDSVASLVALGFNPTDRLYPEPSHGWEERQYQRGLAASE